MDYWFDTIVGLMVGGYFIALGFGAKVRPEGLRGKKVFVALGLLIMLGGFSLLFIRNTLDNIPLGMTSQQIVEKIKTEMQIPSMIDAMTRIDAIEAGDGRVIFSYTVKAENPTEFKDMIDKVIAFMKNGGCNTKSNKQMLLAGIALEFRYTMLDGPTAEPIVLTPKGCGF